MFGYTVPMYQRMSAGDLSAYRRYYCETCHQLRDGYGLLSTAAVNYDMTFNAIVVSAASGADLRFEGTPRSALCVFEGPKAGGEMFRRMAAYTVLLTKWELYDDRVDSPSARTNFIELALGRAIRKAERDEPGFDDRVGKGFELLRKRVAEGCTDAARMGWEFGGALAAPLSEIAGEHDRPEMRPLFSRLAAAVYVVDAVDDLEEDFAAGTYNPFLRGCGGFVNRAEYMRGNAYRVAETINGVMGELQRSYSALRPSMRGLEGVADNIVYLGLPDSARKAMGGGGAPRRGMRGALEGRRARNAEYRSDLGMVAAVQLHRGVDLAEGYPRGDGYLGDRAAAGVHVEDDPHVLVGDAGARGGGSLGLTAGANAGRGRGGPFRRVALGTPPWRLGDRAPHMAAAAAETAAVILHPDGGSAHGAVLREAVGLARDPPVGALGADEDAPRGRGSAAV